MAREKTSPRVAKIAGSIMQKWKDWKKDGVKVNRTDWVVQGDELVWGDVLALAASVLTQSEPPKKKAKARAE